MINTNKIKTLAAMTILAMKVFAAESDIAIPYEAEIRQRLESFKEEGKTTVLLLGTDPRADKGHFDLSPLGENVGVFYHSVTFPSEGLNEECVKFDFNKPDQTQKFSGLFSDSLDIIVPDNYTTHHAIFSREFFQHLTSMLKIGGKMYLGPDGIEQLGRIEVSYTFETCAPEAEGLILDSNGKSTRIYDAKETKAFFHHKTTLQNILEGTEYYFRESLGVHDGDLTPTLAPKIKCKFKDDSQTEEIMHQLDQSYQDYVNTWWHTQALSANSTIEVQFGRFPFRTTEKCASPSNDQPCTYFEITRTA
jgi:hypothetical protein